LSGIPPFSGFFSKELILAALAGQPSRNTTLAALAIGGIGAGVGGSYMLSPEAGVLALVACVQAYIFAILTCIYLNDALHPGH